MHSNVITSIITLTYLSHTLAIDCEEGQLCGAYTPKHTPAKGERQEKLYWRFSKEQYACKCPWGTWCRLMPDQEDRMKTMQFYALADKFVGVYCEDTVKLYGSVQGFREMRERIAVEQEGRPVKAWDHFVKKTFMKKPGVSPLARQLYPPVPVVSRKSIGEDVIGGYHIPKGTEFLVNIAGCHRNPKVWGPDSLEFDHNRHWHEDAFMPFANGPHKCIGYQLATVEMIVALCTLLAAFRFERVPGDGTREKHIIVLKPEPPIKLKLFVRQ